MIFGFCSFSFCDDVFKWLSSCYTNVKYGTQIKRLFILIGIWENIWLNLWSICKFYHSDSRNSSRWHIYLFSFFCCCWIDCFLWLILFILWYMWLHGVGTFFAFYLLFFLEKEQYLSIESQLTSEISFYEL